MECFKWKEELLFPYGMVLRKMGSNYKKDPKDIHFYLRFLATPLYVNPTHLTLSKV